MLRKIRHLAHIKQRRSSSQASGLPQHLASQTPVPPSTGPASSEYNLLFKEALDEYRNALGKHKERTETDLTTHPIIVRLESCQSIEDVMAEFHKCTSEFDTFRNGKGKRNLMRKLYPIVTVILALRPTDTLGEGFGVMFPPANAILGAVGILLEAIKNVSESYDSLVELLGCVSSFLDRLKIYSNGPSITSMKPMLLKILTEVISILALATAEVKQSRLNKYVQKLLGDTTVEDALRKLNRLTSKEALTVEAETLDATYRLLKALDTLMQTGAVATDKLLAAISELDRHVANIGQIEKDINDMKRDAMGEKYRRWLSPPDPSTNHNTAVESHQDGTSTWFIEGDVLAEWKTTGSLLWIHGKPGSGKSILCSAVIEDINRTWLAQPDIILAYFYCDFRDTAKQHVRSILAHILVSIAANSDCAARILSELHSSNANGSHQPRHDALILCLHKMLEASSDHSIFIVIDALDECPESESKRRHVLQLIERIVKWRIQHVRICVTSRPEVDIRNTLEPLSPCSVALSNEMGQGNAIADYVRTVIESESDSGFGLWRENDKEMAITELSTRANGMFRWVYCQLERLHRCHPAKIRNALDNLPESLDETYRRMLLDLDTESWDYTHRLFQCLAVCREPLSIEDLAEVLAVDFDSSEIPRLVDDLRQSKPEDAILTLCSSFVVVDPERHVQFAHFSVKEFLFSSRLFIDPHPAISRFYLSEKEAHLTLTQACLAVLLTCSDFTEEASLDIVPLASYSTTYLIPAEEALYFGGNVLKRGYPSITAYLL
ncbi:hypothetical protein CERSUDRAFT_125879 [Gelatoporia subvermispora B]|uniref:NACHT domain-containing protein n=1 Tax=Ceriporiopsis subvermispora (strain B) TaxID=914234 RepID=M2R3T8_CERS8|nr:hypothetical protein CERSUDRAFT_125879 [Gelatoporia subvermispora B]